MKINPVSQSNASEKVKGIYNELQSALGAQTLPLFFTYIGAFPEYLEYISGQLTQNLNDPNFLHITVETKKVLLTDIHTNLQKSDKVNEWVGRYRHSPQFHNFQENLSQILTTNIKLAYIFIALREAVKGWAVAAKKLPDSGHRPRPTTSSTDLKTDHFVFGNLTSNVYAQSHGLVKSAGVGMERDLLREYIFLTQHDFTAHMNTDTFWELRIRQEKYIISLLAVLPHLIFSPYNVIVPLTKKYETFPELLHLLSEHFPTYAMQRMIFSGYMKPE